MQVKAEMHLKLVVSGLILLVVFASPVLAKIDAKKVAGMWLFEENGGDVALDSSGNGNDGNVVGPAKWVQGKFGKAMEFNGQNVYVEVASNDGLVLEELTMVAWAKIKPSAGVRWQSIMMKGQNPRNYLLVVDKDSQMLQLSITKGAMDAWAGPIAGPVITDEQWHHLAGVIGEKEGLTIYTDGVQAGQQPYSKPSLNAAPEVLRIGDGSAGGHQLDGLLDEVALFNVPLDEGDIQDIMNEGLEAATGLSGQPVQPSGKLAITWCALKMRR